MSWNLVLAVHILGATIWVGGMFFSLLVLRPSLGVLEPPMRLALHAQVFQRFFRVIWHVMPLTLLSGYAILFGVYGGFRGANPYVHVMHLLGLVMAAVFVWIFLVPWKGFRGDAASRPAAVDRIRKAIGINFALGVVAIVMGALGN